MAAVRAQRALEKVIEELDAEIAALNEERLGAVQALATMRANGHQNSATVPDHRMNLNGMSLIEAAKIVLKFNKEGEMTTEEIANALLDNGFPTESDNFKSVVSTMLNRYKDEEGIYSVGRALWSLSS